MMLSNSFYNVIANFSSNMDDTIDILNARNRGQTIQPPPQQPDEITNISIISRDESNTDNDTLGERPVSTALAPYIYFFRNNYSNMQNYLKA